MLIFFKSKQKDHFKIFVAPYYLKPQPNHAGLLEVLTAQGFLTEN
jgi:hypothetical protein